MRDRRLMPTVGYLDAACRDRDRLNVVHLEDVLRARRQMENFIDERIAEVEARAAALSAPQPEKPLVSAREALLSGVLLLCVFGTFFTFFTDGALQLCSALGTLALCASMPLLNRLVR